MSSMMRRVGRSYRSLLARAACRRRAESFSALDLRSVQSCFCKEASSAVLVTWSAN